MAKPMVCEQSQLNAVVRGQAAGDDRPSMLNAATCCGRHTLPWGSHSVARQQAAAARAWHAELFSLVRSMKANCVDSAASGRRTSQKPSKTRLGTALTDMCQRAEADPDRPYATTEMTPLTPTAGVRRQLCRCTARSRAAELPGYGVQVHAGALVQTALWCHASAGSLGA